MSLAEVIKKLEEDIKDAESRSPEWANGFTDGVRCALREILLEERKISKKIKKLENMSSALAHLEAKTLREVIGK